MILGLPIALAFISVRTDTLSVVSVVQYLQCNGIKLRYAPLAEGWPLRRRLHTLLGRAIRGIPQQPMPHGKGADQLWNLFPETFRVEREGRAAWLADLRSGGPWAIVPESPDESATYLERLPATFGKLPEVDVYFVPLNVDEDGGGEVFALDHEGMGPWRVGKRPGPRPMAELRHPRPPFVDRGPATGEPLSPAEAAKVRADLARAFRSRGIYVPSYPLARSGPARDHLWNYLPREFDAEIGPGSLAAELLASAEGVLAWDDGPDDAIRRLASGADLRLGDRGDAYYLEWPHRRWLIAVPGLALAEREESPFRPSLVPL